MSDTVQYDDFAKLDIRVGTITAVEPVPETERLLKCTVDFGEFGQRTIVSGIAQFRSPESLVGKQCPYIVNLEPRTLRGVESQGMLLAASLEDGIALLHPDSPVPPGTKLK